MAFELSFTPEFFIGPHDLDGSLTLEELQHPTTVYQAILGMDPTEFRQMAEDVFGTDPDLVDADMVLAKIQETNTCGDLRSPVEVWIDDEGWHTVRVY
jgi:hypothetical protein